MNAYQNFFITRNSKVTFWELSRQRLNMYDEIMSFLKRKPNPIN